MAALAALGTLCHHGRHSSIIAHPPALAARPCPRPYRLVARATGTGAPHFSGCCPTLVYQTMANVRTRRWWHRHPRPRARLSRAQDYDQAQEPTRQPVRLVRRRRRSFCSCRCLAPTTRPSTHACAGCDALRSACLHRMVSRRVYVATNPMSHWQLASESTAHCVLNEYSKLGTSHNTLHVDQERYACASLIIWPGRTWRTGGVPIPSPLASASQLSSPM
ncbi:hypothetical protein C8T65DRAFT_40738 [Cerioporus squamosus]|nr:hypothetical protein C8T65DRAFT_40738 [Cerioporus squamosus]